MCIISKCAKAYIVTIYVADAKMTAKRTFLYFDIEKLDESNLLSDFLNHFEKNYLK